MPFKRYMERLSQAKIKEALEGKHRKFDGYLGMAVTGFAAFVGFYHLYTAYFGPPVAILFRNIHWMMAASLLFLLFPARIRSPRHRPELWDLVCVAITLVIAINVWMNWEAIANRAGAPIQSDIILGLLLVLMVVEAARRTVGWPIIIVSVLFLFYAYYGQLMPGILLHRGYSIERIFPYLYLTDAGVFGIPLGVSSRFIMLFIVFGAFLERSGAGIFFRDLSLALTGKYVGGPAKSAVLFSAFIGSISGSSTANVATTGTFTIPLMKKLGYQPVFAAGVEANASCGGQILPPVMGAAAFVMAEFLGVEYRVVMIAAAFPALMYFGTSYFMIHYEALKKGLLGMPREDLPSLKKTLKEGFYFFTPLIMLIVLLMIGRSPGRSVFYAVIATVVLSWFKKENRMYIKDIIQASARGVINSLEVVAACAAAGIIIGMVTMTGLGLKFSTIISEVSGGQLMIALPLTMVASLLLGMGIPTTAKYIILATLVAPALVAMGAPLISAHLFILYFGADADVTPPVGLASYAAAGIAGADPLRTGWEAFKIGLTAYVMPFLIIYYPAIILRAPWHELIYVLPTCLLGSATLAAAVRGFYLRKMPLWHRALVLVGSIMLMDALIWTDLVGLALVVLIYIIEYRATKGERRIGEEADTKNIQEGLAVKHST